MNKRGILTGLIFVILVSGMIFVFAYRSKTHQTLPTKEFVENLLGNSPVKIKPAEEIQIVLVGDIMLSRNVALAIENANDPQLPFRGVANLLTTSDFNFGNLESPFTPTTSQPIVGGHSLVFSAPSENIKGLVNNGFRVLSLANNHALDRGLKTILSTKQLLADNGIVGIGVGENLEAAWNHAAIELKGTKLCFLATSYASINDGGKTKNNYVARIDDLDTLQAKISDLKFKCNLIIANMHAGTEYTRKPNQSQITFAHAAIDAGADLVVGTHPHWVQTIEKYNGKYIFYSLGNFIFDQMWSQDTKEGLVLKIQISKTECHHELISESNKIDSSSDARTKCLDDLKGPRVAATLDSIELIPIIIENYFTPRLATEEETKKILEKIDIKEAVLH